jgi:hypothetical protein
LALPLFAQQLTGGSGPRDEMGLPVPARVTKI